MPSSWSSSLRFELQFTGENINLWGDKLNAVLAHADYAIAGFLTKALTGDYTLTTANAGDDEARASAIKLTGAGPFTVTIPSVSKAYNIWNACSAALTVTTGAGLTVTIDPGDKCPIWSDGSNVNQITYGGFGLKAFIAASVLGATGSLPAAVGNDGKALVVVAGSWVPTQITPSIISGFSAGAAVVRAGTSTSAAMTPGDTYAAFAEVNIPITANHATPDFSGLLYGVINANANFTLDNPSAGMKPGQVGSIRVIQDTTGSRLLSAVGSWWKRSGGLATLTTTANAIDFLEFRVITSTYILYDIVRNPS